MAWHWNHQGYKRRRVIAGAVLAMLAPARFAAAQVSWVGGTSNWNNPNNWTPAGVPMGGDVHALSTNGIAQSIDYDFTGLTTLQLLALSGDSANASEILSMSANSLTANTQAISAYGIFNQSGGTNNCGQIQIDGNSNSTGVYALSNGTLSAGSESVGYLGPGNFNQSGGSNTINNSGPLYVGITAGSSSTYTLSGTGTLSASGSEYVDFGGSGIFNQSGGSNIMPSGASLYVGYSGGASGTYLLGGGGSLSVAKDEDVGLYGTGNFNQTGGTNTVTGNLNIAAFGLAAGTYTLSGTSILAVGGNLVVKSVGSMVVGNAGVLNVSGGVTAQPGCTFAITGGGSVNLLPHAGTYAADVVASLSVAGSARLDVSNNALDLPAATLSTFNTLVKQGYAGGTWNGSAGLVSNSAAGDTTHLTAVGVIQNNQSGSALFTASNLFDGSLPGVSDVLVKYTYYGDTNLDGKVDGSDYSRIDVAYPADKVNPAAMTGWFNGDFNYDNVVNGSDYTLIDNAFNSQGTQLTAEIAGPAAAATDQIAGADGGSSVPEPSVLGLLMMGGIGLLGQRKNRRG